MKHNRLGIMFATGLLLIGLGVPKPAEAKKKKEPPVKSIRGHVTDSQEKSIVGAKIYVLNVNKKTTRVLITDADGLYAVYGLDPKMDYEVHAEYGRLVSETKTVSHFLNRFDNVFNFELGPKQGRAAQASNIAAQSVSLQTEDGVHLTGDWYLPEGDQDASFPAVLLLHGFGQDRHLWEDFIQNQLLPGGFAALSLDLRGHGDSKTQGNTSISAASSWRTDPNQFPRDLGPAIRWLKNRHDVDGNRIAVVGCDLGGDLAFVASGKYEDVRAAVVVSGNVENAKRLSDSSANFEPHSILYLAAKGDSGAEESARQFDKLTGFPVRMQIFENSQAHGSKILEDIPEAAPLIVDWLKKM